MHESDTIVAVATAPGPAGIAVIRISGPESVGVASRLFSPRPGSSFSSLSHAPSHRVLYGFVKDPGSGLTLDEALFTVMRGPRSFTGEDVVEISCHGSPAVASETTALCCRLGARHAQPGEFTRRALLNGRLDLAKAEALLDLVTARTAAAARAAAENLSGGVSESVSEISRIVLDILAKVEACLDFPEEVGEPDGAGLAEDVGQRALLPVLSLAGRFHDAEVLRKGVYTVIAGRPNAGKSSLLNALAQQDRALVTEVAGTTRDVVEESITLDGMLFVLADTAGLSTAPDRLEALGMERSRKALAQAGLVLYVADACRLPDPGEPALLENEFGEKPVIVLANKADLAGEEGLALIEKVFSGREIIRISALTGQNLDILRSAMRKAAGSSGQDTPPGPNLRQRDALEKAAGHLRLARENLLSLDFPLAAEDLRGTLGSLGEISGQNISSEVLDRIFSSFCIGK